MEREIFLKEENSGTFRISSYFVGKTLIDIPYVILYPSFIFFLTYKMLGINEDTMWM